MSNTPLDNYPSEGLLKRIDNVQDLFRNAAGEAKQRLGCSPTGINDTQASMTTSSAFLTTEVHMVTQVDGRRQLTL